MSNTDNTMKKKIFGISLSLLVIGALISCASRSGNVSGIAEPDFGGLGKATDPVPFMQNARTGVLSNGLRYFILENSRPENRAFLTLAVNAGSVLEEDNERGLAHFVEHMAFNGTERFPDSELVNYIRSLGMTFGAHLNAYTYFDETVYRIEVPVETDEAGRRRIPDRALAIIDDWSHAITFKPEAVEAERRVMIEEYRWGLGAMERFSNFVHPIVTSGSPYAERMVIGKLEILETAPPERLVNFYRRWYRADNMALIFVGDFDGEALEKSLTSHFSMPAPTTPLNRPRFDLPEPQSGLRTEIFTDPELTFTQVYIYSRRTRRPITGDLAEYRESVMDTLINTMLSVRSNDAVALPETPYLALGGFHSRYGKSSRFYLFAARAKEGRAEDTLKELLLQKESLLRFGFTEAELDRAKRVLLSDLTRRNSERDRQQSYPFVQRFTAHYVTGESMPDIEWELDAVQRLLPGIGVREIANAVKDYFSEDDLIIFAIAPASEADTLSSHERMRQLVSQTRRASISPPVSAAVSGDLLDSVPIPGRITSENVDPETGAVLWTLSNGAKVIVRETENRNNEITLYAMARGGILEAEGGTHVSASLATDMLSVSGAGNFSLQDIQRILAGRQISLSLQAFNFSRVIDGFSTVEDLKPFFELLHLSFTQPRFDNSAIEALLDQRRTFFAQRRENPQTFFTQEVSRTIFGNNPYFAPLQPEDIYRVNIRDAFAFIERILNPADYTFVFTGNINKEDFRFFVETYLASVPQGERHLNSWTDIKITRPDGLRRTIYRGMDERSNVYLGRFIPFTFSEESSAVASVLHEYLRISLYDEIRERLGGVYGIQPNLYFGTFLADREIILEVNFSCDPRRAEELIAAVEEELNRIANGNINAEVFARAVDANKQNWERSIQNNRHIAWHYAQSDVILNLPLSRLNRQPELFGNVTPEAIQEIAQHLLTRDSIQMILYPESWAHN